MPTQSKSKIKLPAGTNGLGHSIKETRESLRKRLNSYREGLPEGETRSCILRLRDIKALIDFYSNPDILNKETPIDSFRIYLFREVPNKLYPPSNQKIAQIGDKGQISFILVPTHNFNDRDAEDRSSANDMFDYNNECLVLYPGGETTGLCPTNCGGSEG